MILCVILLPFYTRLIFLELIQLSITIILSWQFKPFILWILDGNDNCMHAKYQLDRISIDASLEYFFLLTKGWFDIFTLLFFKEKKNTMHLQVFFFLRGAMEIAFISYFDWPNYLHKQVLNGLKKWMLQIMTNVKLTYDKSIISCNCTSNQGYGAQRNHPSIP